MRKNSNSYIFRSVYQIDMKFDKQLRPATETSRVVSYDGKTIPRWQTAAILKIDISPYLSNKNLAIANRSRNCFAQNSSRASIRLITHDLEIYLKDHSRSLETEPLDRSYTTYH